MPRARRSRPEVETVEPRALPSAAVPIPAAAAQVAAASTASLTGQLHGTYRVPPNHIPDAGTSYVFQGNGRLGPRLNVLVGGTLTSPGFVAQSRAGGTLNLTNPTGTMKLQLNGPLQPGFQPLPTTFTYRVVAATGRFRSLIGTQGVVGLTLGQPGNPSAFSFRFNPA